MKTIRPQSFVDFHGQPEVVAALKPAVRSARARGEPLDHVLLTGPAGLGKTTLGMSVLPTELGAVKAVALNCAAIEKPQQLLSVVSTVPEGGVLFLDEIHCLVGVLQDHILTVLEDQRVTLTIDGNNGPTVMSVDLPKFTVIGATTRAGRLSEPMRDRFMHQARLQLYTDVSMTEVLHWVAKQHNVSFTDEAAACVVPSCHGTARYAVRFVKACIDTIYASDEPVDDAPVISEAIAAATLERLGFHVETGLSQNEQSLLRALYNSEREHTGLNTLSALLDEDSKTVEDVYEPWLLLNGFIIRDSRGRTLTNKGREFCDRSNSSSGET